MMDFADWGYGIDEYMSTATLCDYNISNPYSILNQINMDGWYFPREKTPGFDNAILLFDSIENIPVEFRRETGVVCADQTITTTYETLILTTYDDRWQARGGFVYTGGIKLDYKIDQADDELDIVPYGGYIMIVNSPKTESETLLGAASYSLYKVCSKQ
jgi:hypothetical protein